MNDPWLVFIACLVYEYFSNVDFINVQTVQAVSACSGYKNHVDRWNKEGNIVGWGKNGTKTRNPVIKF